MSRVYVKYAPDDPEMAWANDANGIPRWMIWSYSDDTRKYGRGIAWCRDEFTADLVLTALIDASANGNPIRCMQCLSGTMTTRQGAVFVCDSCGS